MTTVNEGIRFGSSPITAAFVLSSTESWWPTRSDRCTCSSSGTCLCTTSRRTTSGSTCYEHTDRTTHCPRKGDAEYWSIVVGDRRIENTVWGYPVPLEGTADLSAYVAFYWNKVDNWFEEDEEVFVHAHDPYKRVDALRSSRHVEVRVNGETLADTTRPVLLFETSLPTRYYIPKFDVRLDLLRPSANTTACPYKGTANYFSVSVPGTEVVENVAWVYRTPIPQVPTIENHLCFFNERVDLLVDGELQERPTTAWS